jgi:hypothetical protein
MQIIERRFQVDGRAGELQIDIYGDTHLGSKSVDEKRLRRDIEETRESGRWWCHVGDVIDGILPGDRRFRSENIADWAWDALKSEELIAGEWARFRVLFEPIQDRCLFVLDGDGKHNTCANVANKMRETLDGMGIPGGFVATYYTFMVNRLAPEEGQLRRGPTVTVPVVFHHGWFAGRKKGGKANNLVDALGIYPEAWGFFCGHGHDKMEQRVNSLKKEGNGFQQWVRRVGMTGSYLLTYSDETTGYGEVKGYAPAGLGRMTLVLRPFHVDDEKRIEIINA